MGDDGDCCDTGTSLLHCRKDVKKRKKNCNKYCKVMGWVGDGRCDDNNNSCGCNWDNGDCCGKSGDTLQFTYCSDCKCSDPQRIKCDGHCGAPNYKGDGNCDDENNNCGCAYDGSDCCGKN